jgi:sec-independent protein translocase protein TatB
MLNVGPLELLVVLAVALVVVGPERLPQLARSVGRALRQFREVQDEVREMVSLGVDDEVREAAAEFKKASGTIRQATDVKGAVGRIERSVGAETAPTPEPAPEASEPEEAGGRPAERLLEDGPTDPSSPEATPGPSPETPSQT